MTRAAIYARRAILNAPLDNQIHAARNAANESGMVVAGVYSDRGVSGLSADRPGLNALMSDAAAGKFDVVLIDDIKRLARDRRVHLAIRGQLYAFNVAIVPSRT